MHEWISVKDRMPDDSTFVLVFGRETPIGEHFTYMDVCYFNSSIKSLLWEHITHWMPLPEPPKE